MSTLNMVGQFRNPWEHDEVEEKRRIGLNRPPEDVYWHPSEMDFAKTVGRAKWRSVGSFRQFLGAIQSEPKGTIERINLFSHAGEGLFAFGGRIDEKSAACTLFTDGALTSQSLTERGRLPRGNGKYEDSLGRMARVLSDRFSVGARIVFYMCNAGKGGLSGEVLQLVANAFRVTASGFAEPVIWCCDWIETRHAPIMRGYTTLLSRGDCATKRLGFEHLGPSLVDKPALPEPPLEDDE